ncbi:hypothetical protein CEXT_340831 [Caerostris extrusa]|uniref:Uncharacterized protein n=1 Tax=Caerostris extrusa TaxID=172846 RepID=A0AAV4YDB6_CAEEX|nr:hypothetical protein CEXT_340831 [Caerostris extrusa]
MLLAMHDVLCKFRNILRSVWQGCVVVIPRIVWKCAFEKNLAWKEDFGGFLGRDGMEIIYVPFLKSFSLSTPSRPPSD